jgi:ABC-type branched-subunit amino acid transport system ATPase component
MFRSLTVAENLKIGGIRRRSGKGVRWSEERIFDMFPKLRSLRDRKAGVLSGGEQQMVAIARALAGDVRLLLLDEPFEGLAPAVTDEVFEAVSRLRDEVPIVIVEHDLDRVLALADRVYVLDRGQVAHVGPAQPLLQDLDYRKQVLWV